MWNGYHFAGLSRERTRARATLEGFGTRVYALSKTYDRMAGFIDWTVGMTYLFYLAFCPGSTVMHGQPEYPMDRGEAEISLYRFVYGRLLQVMHGQPEYTIEVK